MSNILKWPQVSETWSNNKYVWSKVSKGDPCQQVTWSQLASLWSAAKYLWSDVCILIQAGGGAGVQMFDLPPHTYLPPAEIAKKRLDKKDYKRCKLLFGFISG